jgi:hypothetical protein
MVSIMFSDSIQIEDYTLISATTITVSENLKQKKSHPVDGVA